MVIGMSLFGKEPALMKRKTAKGLIFDKSTGQFLLTRFLFSLSHHYGFVGGGVEKNEKFEDALRREMKEEVGIGGDSIEEILPLEGEALNRLLLVGQNLTKMFLVVLSKTPEVRLNWESSDSIWVEPAHIREHLSPHYTSMIEQIIPANKEVPELSGL